MNAKIIALYNFRPAKACLSSFLDYAVTKRCQGFEKSLDSVIRYDFNLRATYSQRSSSVANFDAGWLRSELALVERHTSAFSVGLGDFYSAFQAALCEVPKDNDIVGVWLSSENRTRGDHVFAVRRIDDHLFIHDMVRTDDGFDCMEIKCGSGDAFNKFGSLFGSDPLFDQLRLIYFGAAPGV